MLLVLPITVGGVKFVSEAEDKLSMYQITYLDEMSPKVTSGIRRLSTDESLILDLTQDAYVLNQYSFGMLEKKNMLKVLQAKEYIFYYNIDLVSIMEDEY